MGTWEGKGNCDCTFVVSGQLRTCVKSKCRLLVLQGVTDTVDFVKLYSNTDLLMLYMHVPDQLQKLGELHRVPVVVMYMYMHVAILW